MKRLLLILSISIAATIANCCMADELCDSARVHFRQGKSALDTTLFNNGKQLDNLRSKIQAAENDSLLSLKGITVIGAASPEGPVQLNYDLSEQRAHAIFDYLNVYEHFPDSAVSFKFLGRDWSGLRRLVENDMNVPDRTKVINLIDTIISSSTPDSEGDENAIYQLRTLGNGIPYNYLYQKLYPTLRESQVMVAYALTPNLPLSSPKIAANMAAIELKDIDTGIILPPTPCQCKPFYMDLKTNMLLDALALPNIGAEFYLGKNISLGANWMYGWWDRNNTHFYWRAYGGDITLRWWFGRQAHEKPLTGHHLGIYGGVVTYDFELGGTGYMGGLPHRTLWDRCNRFGGIEYGYSLPVARRLNIDFTIGIGYLGGKYLKYNPQGKHYVWQSTHNLKWFGPTRAEISLVWLIGCDNYNIRKGGAR